MYYGFVVIAVVMFGLQFLTNQQYQKDMGSGIFQAAFFNLLGCVLGIPILLMINKFQFEFTPFTLLMSCVAFTNSILFSICSLRAFERVNLSMYSLLSMLGGMLLPLIVGVLFYQERMTFGIVLCVLFIVGSLSLTIEKDEEEKKGGFLFYAGVFFFNGMSGVISKFYTDAPFAKASSAGYSILTALVTAFVSLAIVAFYWAKKPPISKKAMLFGVSSGVLSKVANYLLLIALTVLPASVNYPMVTGGTIIVSTIIAAFSQKKPKKKEWLAVVLAFMGVLFLTLLPI